jgi:DNA-binding NarL/FixJ family response regulator
MKTTVMLVDDHKMIREGIKQLIEINGEIEVIAEAGSGEECIKILQTVTPDVLLLDINMPKMNGIVVLKELKKINKDVRVLMLTMHNEVEYLIRAVDIGVEGYVLKDSESSELIKAICEIKKGNTYIQPQLIPILNHCLMHRDYEKKKIDQLTKREVEVLKNIAKGMFNREIACEMGISERTVKNHISNIFKKIDVLDRTQAAVFAIKNNLVTLF